MADERGLRRLDDPSDWVVAETAAALRRNAPVIPVLVDGARMPARSELPDVLASLASRQGMTLRYESFSSDVGRLIAAIDKRVRATAAATIAPAAAAGQQVAAVNPATVEADYTAGLAAFFAQRWDQAIDPFQRVLSQQPDHQAAADRLAEARRHQQLTTWNSQADRAAVDGRWSDAVVLLENIRSLDPEYPDLSRRLQAATRKRHVAELETDIHTLAAAGQWPAVVAAGQELAALDPNRADPDGLVTRAQAALAESRRLHLAALYSTAGQAEAAGRVNEAMQALEEITRLDPANADAAQRLHALRAQQAAWPQSSPTRSQPPPPQVAGFATPLMQPPTPPGPPDQAAPGPAVPPPPQKRFPVWIAAVVAGLVIVAVVVSVVVINALQKGRVKPSASQCRHLSRERIRRLHLRRLRVRLPRPTTRATCAPMSQPTYARVAPITRHPRGTRWRSSWSRHCDASKLVPVCLRRSGTSNSPITRRWTRRTRRTFAGVSPRETAPRTGRRWTSPQRKGKKLSGGLLHCYEADGSATFAWTHDYLHIVSFASDGDLSFAAMKKWWEHAGPYRQP